MTEEHFLTLTSSETVKFNRNSSLNPKNDKFLLIGPADSFTDTTASVFWSADLNYPDESGCSCRSREDSLDGDVAPT